MAFRKLITFFTSCLVSAFHGVTSLVSLRVTSHSHTYAPRAISAVMITKADLFWSLLAFKWSRVKCCAFQVVPRSATRNCKLVPCLFFSATSSKGEAFFYHQMPLTNAAFFLMGYCSKFTFPFWWIIHCSYSICVFH